MTTGVYPGMQVWFNMQKLTNVIHCINRIKRKNVISIEAKRYPKFGQKAKIQYPFMVKVSVN